MKSPSIPSHERCARFAWLTPYHRGWRWRIRLCCLKLLLQFLNALMPIRRNLPFDLHCPVVLILHLLQCLAMVIPHLFHLPFPLEVFP